MLAEDDLEGVGLLPIQQVGRCRPSAPPEVQLMAAVLTEALVDFRRYAGSEQREARAMFTRARNWIASPDRTWPYSFENICAALELDPDHLRRSLLVQRAREPDPRLLHRAGVRRIKRLPARADGRPDEPARTADQGTRSDPSEGTASVVPTPAKPAS